MTLPGQSIDIVHSLGPGWNGGTSVGTQVASMTTPPIVVYHVASMGEWQRVVKEQLRLLRDCGLADSLHALGESIRLTHVGPGLDWILAEADRVGVALNVIRSDPNTDHYETFAMLEIDRLAKLECVNRPILYFHTKGVSAPFEDGGGFKQIWRRVMEEHLVRPWREHLPKIADGSGYDAVGFCWYPHGEQHFSGNFWMARPDWIRRLPEFAWYHGQKNLVRYSCEMWIGALQWCRAYSLGITHKHRAGDFNWSEEWPIAAEPGRRLNLGCGGFYGPGWINVDLNPGVKADLREDCVQLPSITPESIDEIYAGHLLEHVEDVAIALARWWAILKPGGKLTVTVPDGDASCMMWRNGDWFPVVGCTADEGILAVATGYRSRAESDADTLGFQRHRRLFDRSTLKLCLKGSDFDQIREVDGHPMMYAPCSRLGWQLAVEATKPADETFRHEVR